MSPEWSPHRTYCNCMHNNIFCIFLLFFSGCEKIKFKSSAMPTIENKKCCKKCSENAGKCKEVDSKDQFVSGLDWAGLRLFINFLPNLPMENSTNDRVLWNSLFFMVFLNSQDLEIKYTYHPGCFCAFWFSKCIPPNVRSRQVSLFMYCLEAAVRQNSNSLHSSCQYKLRKR